MKGINRVGAIGATTLLLASTFLALVSAPAAATSGRDSPATAVDVFSGPFQGLFDNSVFVSPGPPVVEDWYKANVVAGQMLQIALFMGGGSRVTVYHPDGCSATGCTSELANTQLGNECLGYGLGTLDLLIVKTESLYIKITPSGAGGATQYYNLAARAMFLTELRSGESFTSTPGNESIHGWAVPVLLSGTCTSGSVWVPQRYVSDYFWINVSDIAGPNHQDYRLQLSWTCATLRHC